MSLGPSLSHLHSPPHPTPHPTAPPQDYANELAYLKSKVDAGGELIITQMFFDVAVFLAFVEDCRAVGITVPIMPGLMVIQAYGGFKRMAAFCKSRVPT